MRSLLSRCLLGVIAVAMASAAPAQETGDRAPTYAGRPLAEALLDLRDRGLRIVFTNRTVAPAMLVTHEPSGSDPRFVLDQLLAPHRLVARDGPGGSVVVLRDQSVGPTSFLITGRVRSLRTGRPLAGVVLEAPATGEQVTSRADGSFRLELPAAGVFALDVRQRGFVVEHLQDIEVSADAPAVLDIPLVQAAVAEERVLVTPSNVSLLRRQTSRPLALSRTDILALPHLGDDLFRALTLLPGITGNDVSAEFHVRGGREDETRILLDGQELYESYHLKDFENALSVVAAGTLDSVDLSTGGFPVEHGDRMAGVLDMTTRIPQAPRRVHVGLSPLSLDLGGGGRFAGGRAGWLAHARRGSTELVADLLGPERPKFWDTFAKLEHQLGLHHGLRLNLLQSDDELRFEEAGEDGFKSRATRYRNRYLWLTHQAVLGDSLLVESALSLSRVERDRRGLELEDDAQFDIDDRRELDIAGARQSWQWLASPRHSLKWGGEVRDFDARYDYTSSYAFDSPLSRIRVSPDASSTRFAGRFASNHSSLYAAETLQLSDRAVIELGLRHDNHSLPDEGLLSPRLSALANLTPRSVLRASWGRFTQSQRPYELQVEDGETAFAPVERSEQQVLGFEHHFAGERGTGTSLRLEAYRRRIENPLRRYENLYEPINTFPEVEPDRVLIAPESSRMEGLEVFARGRSERLGWWANYTYSTAEDRLDGLDVPRRFDQTHALNLDLDLRLGALWHLNLAWRFHTGRPTTPLTLREIEEDGETLFVPVLGVPFSDRLPDYHRLDLRASRRWRAGNVDWTLFLDVQNAYDRRNVAGFDYDIDDELGVILPQHETWAQILPSIGCRVEF